MTRRSSQQTTVAISMILSLLSFGVGIWSRAHGPVTPLPPEVEWLAFVLIALLIPLYTAQASVQLSIRPDLASITEDLAKALGGGKVVHLGTATDVVPRVIDRLKIAKEVLNTYIISDVPYPEQIRNVVESGIEAFIRRDDTRLEETCSEAGKARVDRLTSRLGTLPRSYRPRIIKSKFSGMPVCNFIILKHSDNQAEIFFGWGYFSGNANESVFWSNEPDLIRFFRSYHMALRHNDVSIEYRP